MLLVASFTSAVRTGDPRFGNVGYLYGYHFTQVTIIFYLIGVILIFFRKVIVSFVFTVIGNVILSGTILYFLYEVATMPKGAAYLLLYGFYIIVFLWIVLIIINILMIKYKEDLSVKAESV